ncbi:MAG: hypothetical protein A2W33_10580 [Chloroflexi bacterium RBG_16_52_11]|nr:MAG: hypothetical protein A2W33_10580 [Chloroflexi bacterium RBG_16_52_11]
MEPNVLKSVVTRIHRRFPEFAGCQPKVRLQNASQVKTVAVGPTYLLTFQSTAKAFTSSGRVDLPRWVRVVVTDNGKILKVTTSR